MPVFFTSHVTWIVVLAAAFCFCVVLYILGATRFQRRMDAVRSHPCDKTARRFLREVRRTNLSRRRKPLPKDTRTAFGDIYHQVILRSRDINVDLKKKIRKALLKKQIFTSLPEVRQPMSTEESGRYGEKEVQRALQWLPTNYKVMHNVRLPHRTAAQEIDSIAIGPNGVFCIETKNYGGSAGGRLVISENGEWSLHQGGRVSGLENPSLQVKRHHTVLHDLLSQFSAPIQDIVVLSNPKTLVNRHCYLPYTLIKSDRLVEYIEGYGRKSLSPSQVQAIYDYLIKRKIT